MNRNGTNDPRGTGAKLSSDDASGVHRDPHAQRRIAQLEAELLEARAAIARQIQDSEQDANTFRQTIERLAYSERVVRQTTTKMIEAEERAEGAEAQNTKLNAQLVELESMRSLVVASVDTLRQDLQVANARELELQASVEQLRIAGAAKDEELEAVRERTSRALAQEESLRDLAESLSRDLAAGASECARLSEDLQAADAREKQALSRATQAESVCASAVAELAESKEQAAQLSAMIALLEQERDRERATVEQLQKLLREHRSELAAARARIASSERQRARIYDVLRHIQGLSDEIAAASLQGGAIAEQVEELDPEHDRVTLVPGRAADVELRRQRDSAAPEILIDGVELADVLAGS